MALVTVKPRWRHGGFTVVVALVTVKPRWRHGGLTPAPLVLLCTVAVSRALAVALTWAVGAAGGGCCRRPDHVKQTQARRERSSHAHSVLQQR